MNSDANVMKYRTMASVIISLVASAPSLADSSEFMSDPTIINVSVNRYKVLPITVPTSAYVSLSLQRADLSDCALDIQIPQEYIKSGRVKSYLFDQAQNYIDSTYVVESGSYSVKIGCSKGSHGKINVQYSIRAIQRDPQ